MKKIKRAVLVLLASSLTLILSLLFAYDGSHAQAGGEDGSHLPGQALVEATVTSKSLSPDPVHIYQLRQLSWRGQAMGAEEAILFYDHEKSHQGERPPEQEERYLKAILMAALMDELY